MKGFYRKQGGARKSLAKEKIGSVQIKSPCLRGKSRESFWVDYLIFLRGMGKTHWTDSFIGADQQIPDWPVKTISLGEVETAIRC